MSQRRLALLASGVVALHTSVTVLEEIIFSTPGFKEHVGGSALTLSMYLCSFLLYLPQSEASGQEGRTRGEKASGAASARSLLAVSTVYVGTSTLTKVSLRYLDVPTQTILKSGKLIPVMLGSLVIMRKRYSLREWVAALMLVSGIAVFNLSSNHPPALQSLLGCICVLCSLVCDALLGNFQQKVLQAGCSVRQLMLHQSAFGILSMLLICGANGSLISAFEMLVKDARLTAILLVWATTITLGTALVLQLVSEFSAVTAVTVTTLRKALTITASFVLFPKAMGWGHPVGATLVLASAFVKQGSAVQLASRWIDRHFGWMRSTQATAAAKAAHTSGKAHV